MLVFLAIFLLPGGAQAQPGKPVATVTSEVGALKVKWGASTGAVRYTVQWKSGDEEYSTTERQATVTGTEHTIGNLKADTDYDVRVTAWDENGDYTRSDEVATSSPAPGKVTGVKVTPGVGGDGTNSLTVSWTAVTGATSYRVQWKSGMEEYNTSDRQATPSTPTDTSHPIPSLVAGTQYTVRVTATNDPDGSAATNDGGDGPVSDEAMGTPKPVQVGTVTPTSEEGALKLGWDKITGATSYKVQWRSGSQQYHTSRQATVTPTGKDREETTQQLTAGTLYTVRVIATNAGGDGAPSVEVTGTPLSGQVTGVRAIAATTPQQLTVSWNAVTGASSYKVQWKSGTEEYDAAARQVTASGTSTTLGGTTPLDGIPHTVRVIATNAGGDGKASADATGRPKPGQVTGVTATTTGQREQATVSWTPAVPGATEYTVQWKSGDQLYHTSRQATTTNLSHVVYNLSAGDYMFRVFATNASGDGLPSTDATGTTVAADDNQVTGVRVTPGVGQLTVEWNPVAGGH